MCQQDQELVSLVQDHVAHLIWGFMAIAHVVAIFPQKNDLIDFESMRRANLKEMDQQTQELVGDGGFRVAKAIANAVPTPLVSKAT